MARRLTILIVDDVVADASEARYTLEDIGIDESVANVHHVLNSGEALEFVQRDHPTTVLMDINLRDSPVDGFELTREIRALNGFEVVILTTSTAPADVGAAKDCGARAYIEKLEGSVFARTMAAFKYVFLDGNYCPPDWVDRFVWIDESYIAPEA